MAIAYRRTVLPWTEAPRPDDELLRRLAALVAGSRHTEAALVAHIGEVDARRLYPREATSSMFVYCLERLHLSEAEAYLRIAAARASREHPVILEMLADGRIHLTAIALLAPHLTPSNPDVLLRGAAHKTKREIEELIAEIAPQPDVRPSIRKLPRGRLVSSTALPGRVAALLMKPLDVPDRLAPEDASSALRLRPEQVDSDALDRSAALCPSAAGVERGPTGERPSADKSASDLERRWSACGEARPATIHLLSPARYKVQFTASAALRDTLERLKALMLSSIPDGDLASIIEATVTEKLERLEARRFGRAKPPARGSRTNGPRKDSNRPGVMCSSKPRGADATRPAQADAAGLAPADVRPRSRYVPARVRRAVYERDHGQCGYVDDQGRRCAARVCLEFHHGLPYAVGGEHSATNASLLCQDHNRLMAEIDFGKRAVGARPTPAAALPCRGTGSSPSVAAGEPGDLHGPTTRCATTEPG